jgi:HTH-type transcriptional regulator/antitoxin HigA
MEIKPVRTERDYEAALAEVERLMDAEEGTDDFDRLDILATLVAAYEAKHFPIEAPDPVAAVKYQMREKGFSQRQLAAVCEISEARMSEALHRKRPLSLGMIRKLSAALGLPLAILVQPYSLDQAA